MTGECSPEPPGASLLLVGLSVCLSVRHPDMWASSLGSSEGSLKQQGGIPKKLFVESGVARLTVTVTLDIWGTAARGWRRRRPTLWFHL